ncbi:MAG TPA: glycosyltransferase family 39 protein [Patescibacteria group bacterium]|nr:glycosyltransferase family 39 protein [Patescibacteria group bacterium]
MGKIKNWIKANPKEFWILFAILILSAFLRLYKIDQYMTFLGDEGRDVIIVRRFLTELHPPLIGPGTSVGNMYLGPLYYYMMAPALLIANFSPVGPAIQIALLGVLTVLFVWFVGRSWFGKTSGLIAAGLYAISPTVITFSRSSWNPNIMPFFALLCIWSVWKVWSSSTKASEGQEKWLIVLGISFAFVLQSHYLGLLLAPTLFIFWLLSLLETRHRKQDLKKFINLSLVSFFLFLALMSPLLIFDIRHGWTNFLAIKSFLVTRDAIGLPLSVYFSKVGSTALMLFTNLIAIKTIYLGISIIFLSVILLVWVLKKRLFHSPYALIFTWLTTGVLGVAYYNGPVYDHYLEFLFPIPFLIVGIIIQFIFGGKNKILKILSVFLIGYITFISFQNNPPITDPTMQMPRTISVAKVIQEKAGNERFNLATISDLNNRDVYKYFLLIWGTKIVDTDPSSLKFTVTDQLFVVCEFPREKCDPIHDSSVWISNFGWTKIVDEWPVWGGTLFKLGHTK